MRTMGLRRLELAGAIWLAVLAVIVAGGGAARAQTAYLVTDLLPGEGGVAGSNPIDFMPAGKHLFFIAEPSAGIESPSTAELWVTDGTAAGTQRVQESSGAFIATVGDLLFLVEDNQLWRSDGTRAGTFSLSAALGPDNTSPGPVAVLGGVLYFISYRFVNSDLTFSEQLWRSDGTVAGTYLLADVGPGLYDYHQDALIVAGNRLFFDAPEPSPLNAWEDLWSSDGTAQGTGPVTGFQQQGLGEITAAGGRVFFFTTPPGSPSPQLWVSDGSKAGTRLVSAVPGIGLMIAAGKQAVFVANDATQKPQIWRSDGTAAGTRLVTSGSGFGLPSFPSQVAALGPRLVFVGGGQLWVAALGSTGPPTRLCGTGGCGPLDENTRLSVLGGRVAFLDGSFDAGYGLWGSDGTPGGTQRLKEVCPSPCFFQAPATQAGNGLFFTLLDSSNQNFYQLWRTDGTRAGTGRFGSQLLSFESQAPPTVAVLQNKTFFAAFDNTANLAPTYELWVSDGTGAAARQLTDATDALGSSPSNLTAVGDQVYFAAFTSDLGLWHSTGTAAGTLPLAILPAPGAPPAVAAFGGVVLVSASGGSLQLWRSDGTGAGTRQLTDFNPPLAPLLTSPPVVAGGQVYFLATLGSGSGSGGGSIWKSDGTPAGTVEVVELPPAISQVAGLAVAGGDIFIAGPGVWKSDGTPGGTVQLTPFGTPVPFGGAPTFLALDGLVYFVAADEQGNATTHLYRTDGTPAGTAAVQVGGISFGDVTNLQLAGGSLYFFADSPGFDGIDLWRTDGTPTGTQILGKFSSSIFGARVSGGLVPFGSGFAFYADDGVHGSELWVTDGTPAGTRLVGNIVPGPLGSNPSGLAAAGGRLWFAADDGVHGNELWESDGTAAGTRMVQDIHPGPAPSNPSGMTAAGGLLFFSADDGLTGQELWALPLGGPGGCVPSTTALCIAGGRFKVEAFWRDFQGNSGAGQAQPLTGDTGTFWFFSPDNVEVIVKVLDGRALDGHFWVFYGALSNVEYSLTVTDTVTGLTRRYLNPLGELASVGDTTAFGPMGVTAIGGPPAGAAAGRPAASAAKTRQREEEIRLTPPGRAAMVAPVAPAAAGGGCQPGPLQLCLNGGRFAVTAHWTDFNGNSGAGTAAALTGETGYFWFFNSGNVETVLKVIDGRALNGHFWVFYGALSDVRYTLTVTDTVTGAVKTYTNPAGQFASVADTSAF
jgi:ELWxxDGT repeat protein